MALVYTTKGLVDSALLTIQDDSHIENDMRITSTKWFLDNELVRQDCNLNILCGQSMTGTQEGI